jgi:hypothetical protein
MDQLSGIQRVEASSRSSLVSGMRSVRLAALVLITLAVLTAPAVAAFPGRNGLIAFNQPNVGKNRCCVGINTIRPDGSGLRRLATRALGGRFSPDGRRLLLYSANHPLFPDGISQRTLSGRGGRAAVDPAAGHAFWTADGEVAVVNSPDERRIVLHRGGESRTIDHGYQGSRPDWSVANRLAYVVSDERRGNRVVTIRPDGSDRRVSRRWPPGVEVRVADWSPDGKRLLIGALRPDPGDLEGDFAPEQILSMKPDFSDRRMITEINGIYNEQDEPAFSPDGRWIVAVTRTTRTCKELFVMPSRGGQRRYLRVLRPAHYAGDVDWQPRPTPLRVGASIPKPNKSKCVD